MNDRLTRPPRASDPVIRIHPNDDVVIARQPAASAARGSRAKAITVAGLVPPGHKIATRAIAAGEPVRRYDQIIGTRQRRRSRRASTCTRTTSSSASFARDYAAGERRAADRLRRHAGHLRRHRPRRRPHRDAQLHRHPDLGQLLGDGRRGRSPTTSGATSNPKALARFPNVDGVVALTHGAGCATDSDGEPLQVLRRTLGGYARHPNFAAVLVVGLGCETNQIQGLLAQERLAAKGARCITFNIQETGGTREDGGARHRADRVAARGGEPGRAPAGAGQPHHGRPAVRRLRRLFRHQRQPGARRRGRPAGAPRRHRDPLARRPRSTAASTC